MAGSRGGVPACDGVGVRVVRGTASRHRDGVMPAEASCPHCLRSVPINHNGTLRWHTPKPKRPDKESQS